MKHRFLAGCLLLLALLAEAGCRLPQPEPYAPDNSGGTLEQLAYEAFRAEARQAAIDFEAGLSNNPDETRAQQQERHRVAFHEFSKAFTAAANPGGKFDADAKRRAELQAAKGFRRFAK